MGGLPNFLKKIFLIALFNILIIFLFLLGLSLPRAQPAQAGVITVCSSGCDYTTVQAAVDAAVNNDTISILEPVLTESHGSDGVNISGKTLTIEGQGMEETILQAASSPGIAPGHVIFVGSGKVILRDLTIRYGNATGGSNGGGIVNLGQLTLERIKVYANQCEGSAPQGGGIYSGGQLTVTNSVIAENTVTAASPNQARGGGIYIGPSSSALIIGSTIRDNLIQGFAEIDLTVGEVRGGGIASSGITLTVKSSTISGNKAKGGSADILVPGKAYGGGISRDQGTVIIIDSTISGNIAEGGDADGVPAGPGYGGGVKTGVGSIINSTIVNNMSIGSGTRGGGFYSGAEAGSGPFIKNSIFANNYVIHDHDGTDVYGYVQSQDYNLIEHTNGYTMTGSSTHNLTSQDPILGALQSNGGPTYTHALLTGSPAIDKGSCNAATTDQRGIPRPVDVAGITNVENGCDMGAYEFLPFSIILPVLMR